MRKTLLAFLAFSLFLAASAAPSSPSANSQPTTAVNLPVTGVHIDSLEAPKGEATGMLLMMSLPASEAFAPNVTVIAQAYALGVQSYSELSKKQFDQLGAKVLSEKAPQGNDWTIEYTMTAQGHACHFYAKAIAADKKIYLVTGVTLISQWDHDGEKIKKCVDSFRLDELPPAPAASSASGAAH